LTVTRLQQRLQARSAAPDLDHLLDRLSQRLQPGSLPAAPRLRWISASVGDTIKMFGIDEVLFFQSDEKYTRVVTAHDEAHVRKPLKEIADGLDPDTFWQVHRGVIVRAAAIQRVQRDEFGRFVLHLKGRSETLAVSQAYGWRFKPM
jgi:DNA-binding LytR/AlgR family response regulator